MLTPPLAAVLALVAPLVGAQGVAAEGLRIMTTGSLGNCVACHALPGQKDIPSTFGPSLSGVGARYDATQLRQWVTDARLVKPDTLMPPFGTTQGTNASVRAQSMLTPEQIDQVVEALAMLK